MVRGILRPKQVGTDMSSALAGVAVKILGFFYGHKQVDLLMQHCAQVGGPLRTSHACTSRVLGLMLRCSSGAGGNASINVWQAPAWHIALSPPQSCRRHQEGCRGVSLLLHCRMCKISAMGPIKSFCHHRLMLLEQKFNLHVMLNADKEFLAQKTAPHRDFYNVRKVGCGVHLAAAQLHEQHRSVHAGQPVARLR